MSVFEATPCRAGRARLIGRMRRLVIAGLCLVGLGLVLAPSAGAQSALVRLTSLPSPPLVGGPALQGEALVWAHVGAHGVDVVKQLPGQAPVTIGSVGGGALGVGIEATPELIVVESAHESCFGDHDEQQCYPYSEYWSSVADGPLTGPSPGSGQVSGEWLGHTETPIGRGEFIVSNPFQPSLPTLRFPEFSQPTLAYPYVASVGEEGSVIVTDARSGLILLEVPKGPSGEDFDEVDSLQSDGTVVVRAENKKCVPSGGQLTGWASLSQPTVHPLQALECARHVTIADGLVMRELPRASQVGLSVCVS